MSDELDNIPNDNGSETHDNDSHLHDVKSVSGMYQDWFLDYASYVILERAVPAIEDGLKPVQRRILHAMREIDDGRFNKVANVIGQTMQYHPHGDAAIGEAMVNLGQKELLIETQGNWGDVRTGDSAAAPRYIEARLSKFALEVAFNPQTTVWQTSYDGRKREPVNLPMKFPLLLAQGVEGIAVGLATKILPHNFIELCKASIDILKEKKIRLYPDFMMGGMIDVSNYNDGLRGGKVRVRAKIEEFDKKTLLIKDIPYGTTTTQLIDSIIKANDSGKIKIKKVVDNTAKHVEIQIQLAPGVSPDITIDALYAFTDCEVSISPNACLIISDKPHFIGVSEILKINTEQTRQLLKRELLIRLNELEEEWHFSSLEKLFIEKRIYRDIEECETWEAVLETIDKGLKPYKKLFRREITRDDVIGLTEIKIKRISKFDAFKADEHIKGVEKEMEEVHYNIEYLTDYTIAYFENLIKKYGKGRERHTEIRTFDAIQAKQVAAANVKLYVNRAEGFIGTTLKKDEFLCDCSDLDDIIIFRRDGKYMVTKVAEKTFVGKDIIHAGVFHKSDERMAYNVIYDDGKTRYCFAKRFNVLGVTRDKEYDLTQGNKNSKIVYLLPIRILNQRLLRLLCTPAVRPVNRCLTSTLGL
jgi:topoisomerase-4 subunit A